MGVDNLAIDAPYARHPETLAAALRYLERTGNDDVAVILGLVEDPVVAERLREAAQLPEFCPICQNKLPGHGVCRRREACREAARERGIDA